MPLPPRWQRARLGAIPTGNIMGEHPDMTATTTGHPPHCQDTDFSEKYELRLEGKSLGTFPRIG